MWAAGGCGTSATAVCAYRLDRNDQQKDQSDAEKHGV
ncbi:MAG: hypothetical protein QOI65_2059, partial [Thermoleophilaceae bacterium]|nr:hypothetical protein [Thermoleophilaceae bacterium]